MPLNRADHRRATAHVSKPWNTLLQGQFVRPLVDADGVEAFAGVSVQVQAMRLDLDLWGDRKIWPDMQLEIEAQASSACAKVLGAVRCLRLGAKQLYTPDAGGCRTPWLLRSLRRRGVHRSAVRTLSWSVRRRAG